MKLIRLLADISWVRFLLATFAGLLSGASSVGLIATIERALRETQFSKSLLAWQFVGLCCLLLVATAFSQASISRLAQQVVIKLQLHLIRSILACPLRQLEEIGTPRLLGALTEDIQAISNASAIVSNLSVSTIVLVGCFIYLCWLCVPLFLFTFVFTILGVISQNFILTKGKFLHAQARERQDKLFEHFGTVTEGIKELKLHQAKRQAFLDEDFCRTAAFVQRHRVKANDLFAIAGGTGLLLFFVPIGLLIFVVSSWLNIPLSILSSYVLTIIFTIAPFRVLLLSLPILSQANIALDKLESLRLSLVGTTEPQFANFSCDRSQWKSLRLIEVTHSYRRPGEDSCFTLGPIDLTFYPGEVVFIVGGNGSGKSTLIKLIAGLYAPEDGAIQFDEKIITDSRREWYRQMFSVVFCDFYLFDRLLGLDNLYLNSQIQDYLTLLQLDSKVTVTDGILSTTALSQGQRKRLALLTAYLEDRAIYIFDEWAADQDPIFKDIFYTQLLPELKSRGKTVIVVSHDDRYFDCCDRVVKLDYGQVVCTNDFAFTYK
jgi:putative pyoverdin transport system ATP-binding/permease protein